MRTRFLAIVCVACVACGTNARSSSPADAAGPDAGAQDAAERARLDIELESLRRQAKELDRLRDAAPPRELQ